LYVCTLPVFTGWEWLQSILKMWYCGCWNILLYQRILSCRLQHGGFGKKKITFFNRISLRKELTFCDTNTGFPVKWHPRNDSRNSILMTCYYPDLGPASDWMEQVFNQSQALLRSGWCRVMGMEFHTWWHFFKRLMWISRPVLKKWRLSRKMKDYQEFIDKLWRFNFILLLISFSFLFQALQQQERNCTWWDRICCYQSCCQETGLGNQSSLHFQVSWAAWTLAYIVVLVIWSLR